MPEKYTTGWIAVLLPAALIVVADAAPAQQSHSRTQHKRIEAPPFRTVKLRKAVDIPEIPDYPKSHRFVGGDSCQMTNGVSYNQCFSVNEEKQAVLDWYAQALQSSGWQGIQTTSRNVSAKKRSSSCNIMTASDFAAHGRTLVTISYFGESQH